jgi:hypothetical protein
MKKNFQVTFVLFLLSISLLSACGPGQVFGPTLTPTPTFTPTQTLAPTPTFTPTPAPTPTVPAFISAITMNCDDQAGVVNGVYRAENNTWGKGTLQGWSQCIGLGNGPDGTLAGRWTWDWLNSGGNVKAYPEIVFGQKPGSSTTSPDLPEKISSVGELVITYDITSTHTGSGNIAFDIWLTNTQNPSKWGVPPITHEIMIWLDRYGSMGPGGNWVEQVDIDDTPYAVYVGENWGDGWTYIAFVSRDPQLGVRTLNLLSFLSYLRAKSLVTGEEYIASIEIGNEVAGGTGETILNKYAVSVR